MKLRQPRESTEEGGDNPEKVKGSPRGVVQAGARLCSTSLMFSLEDLFRILLASDFCWLNSTWCLFLFWGQWPIQIKLVFKV